jgi:hypothetical protein
MRSPRGSSRFPAVHWAPIAAGLAAVALLAGLLVMDGRERARLRQAAHASRDPAPEFGKFFPAEVPAGPSPQQQELLSAVGYSAGYEPAPSASGVVRYDRDRAWNGLNLVLSGHGPEAALMDMDGRVRHTWSRRYGEVFQAPRISGKRPLTFDECLRAQPGLDPGLIGRLPGHFLQSENPGHGYFRRAHLYPNGDLLTFYSSLGAVKFDRDSNVLWSYPTMAHHDLDVGPDGRVYMLSMAPREVPGLGEVGYVLSDYIAVFSDNGTIERTIDVLDSFLNSRYAAMVTRAPQAFDLLHTNTITLLDGTLADRIPAFRAGNLLISCRNIDTVAVIDPDAGQVVWALKGPWVMQHDPVVLDSGDMLLFDNLGHGGYSRIVEFDPRTQEIAWEFSGSPPESFHSFGLGAVARLPNGNTLVTESTRGRAFELTPDKDIVWEFVNPERTGENNELIAAVFDVVRLPADYADSWLPAPETD